MSELKTLNGLFENKHIYVIPDYQRGYIWDVQQLADFWEDLQNIKNTPHYMGVISIKAKEDEERVYEVVDGQQRLTTSIILLQSILEFARKNKFKETNGEIIFSDYEEDSIKNIEKTFLYTKNVNTDDRIYKFKYICDKESRLYFNHKILNEPNAPELHKTLYTNKLEGAKAFFTDRLKDLYDENEGIDEKENAIKGVYKKLVEKLKFNVYTIEKDFDTNVAFESMNNRGKKLSILELLKNRLLYLTTIISDNENDIKNTKQAIIEAWAEIYKQLGKTKYNNEELLDDDFLKTHWIFYWGYSRKKGGNFDDFLLKKQFIRKKVYESLKNAETIASSDYETNSDEDDANAVEDNPDILTLELINDYVKSLQGCVGYWADSLNPAKAERFTNKEDIVEWLDKFNRINAGAHFRPLITVALQKYGENENESSRKQLVSLLQTIERFVFIVFALNHFRSNSYDAKFYNYSKELYHGNNDVTIEKIIDDMNNILEHDCFTDKGEIVKDFADYIKKRFKYSEGYYAWDKIKYFLYEYEMYLTKDKNRCAKVTPKILLEGKDKTIEHIYPQSDTNEYWVSRFNDLTDEEKNYYKNALGNLLLLSQAINSALQNDSFDNKKEPIISDDNKTTLRTGYNEGSYSEIEVANKPTWTKEEITKRSKKLIEFLEERWKVKFSEDCKKILINPINIIQLSKD